MTRFQGGSFAAALQNRRNKARMSMKTKDRVLWSAAAERAELPPCPRTASLLRHDAVPGRQLRYRTPKPAEQSENVYENKGSRWDDM
jgi:hypothetical protein